MTNIYRCAVLLLISIMLLGGCAPSNAPKSEAEIATATSIKKMVDEKKFTIKVNRATTSKGRTINLTTAYTVSLEPNKFVCDLPFYGESFAGAGYGGSGPVAFTSNSFDVSSTNAKKGGWDISIKPNDQQDVRSITIYVSESGYANLNFIFQNRTPMQYYGSLVMP